MSIIYINIYIVSVSIIYIYIYTLAGLEAAGDIISLNGGLGIHIETDRDKRE